MKIPEGSANVGAYYGNEENGQWQPNGVMIDSGVGGGVVGSGDAGVARPLYPVHIPRAHVPAGYVMAGAYYGAYPPVATPHDDFADYMWMENEEEFDKQVMQQLEEEALMEQCIEAMLEDEQRERNGHRDNAGSLSLEETVSRSTLNPLAAEFVPTTVRLHTEESSSPTETETPSQTDAHTTQNDSTEVPDPAPPQTDPPEVSVADLQTTDKRTNDKKDKDTPDMKDTKKSKNTTSPLCTKSDTKVNKKRDLKAVKSHVLLEHSEPVQPEPAAVEETTSGFKPINYAAAAKANKPKKPSTPTDKPQHQPPKTDKPKPADKIEKKDKIKTEKVVQRKNSAK